MHQRRAVVLALAALLVLTAGLSPARADFTRSHMFNERYCELLPLRAGEGGLTATVYNTVGLNLCPQEWWDSFTAEQASVELGAVYTVKNGPRFWTFDKASTPEIGETVTVFGEQLREVATITVGNDPTILAQQPYVERTINRQNTWKWKKGRVTYRLQSPEGGKYFMQSYTHLVDPEQEVSDLKNLGDRLELPEGWTFSVKKLKKPYVLNTEGTATIVQDDLKNTYQRVN